MRTDATGEGVRAGDAAVATADAGCTSGVIHALDAVPAWSPAGPGTISSGAAMR